MVIINAPHSHCECHRNGLLKSVFSKCTTCCSRGRRCRKAVTRSPVRLPTSETLTTNTLEAKNHFDFFRAAVESFFGTFTEFVGSPEQKKDSSFRSRSNPRIFCEASRGVAFARIGVCAPPQSFCCNALKGWKFPGTRGSSL
ncbi:MAG: hypothetical protein AB1490_25655 [Pseudomonadota bacterium]